MKYILFAISFLLYGLTASNGVGWENNAILMLFSNNLIEEGFSNSPFLILGGKFFTLFPIGTIAFRLNLFSSFCGALTIVMIYLSLLQFMKFWTAYDKNFIPFLSSIALNRLQIFMKGVAFLTSLVFALSRVFWIVSIRFHSYALLIFFLILLFYLFIRGSEKSEEKKWVYLFALFSGIGVANQLDLLPYLLILFIPLLWVRTNRKIFKSNFYFFTLLCFLIGFSISLLSLIRIGDNQFDKNLNIYKMFFSKVPGKSAFLSPFSFPLNLIPFRIITLVQLVIREMPIVFFFLAFLGFPAAMQPKRRFWLPFLFIVIINLLLFSLKDAGWKLPYFLPTFFTLYSISALGGYTFFLIFFSRSLENYIDKKGMVRYSSLPQLILLLMIFSAIVFQVLKNYELIYEGNNYLSGKIVKKSVEKIYPNSILYVNSKDLIAPLIYLQSVEHYRRDIVVLKQYENTFPTFSKENQKEVDSFLQETLKSNKNVFIDTSSALQSKIPLNYLKPISLCYQIKPVLSSTLSKANWFEQYVDGTAFFNGLCSDNSSILKEEININSFMRFKNRFLLMIFYSGLKKETITEWKETALKDPSNLNIALNLIKSYLAVGEIDRAKKILEENLILNFPDQFEVRFLRGKIFLEESNINKAEKEFNLAVRLDSSNQEALLALAEVYFKLNKKNESLEIVNYLLRINPKHKEALRIKTQIGR